MTVTVALPQLYEPVANRRSGLTVIETAELNARTHEVLLALALDRIGNVEFRTTTPDRATWLLKTWSIPYKTTRLGDVACIRAGAAVIWLTPGPRDLPCDVSHLFVPDAHLHESLDVPTNATLAGWFCEAGHWFFDLARKVTGLLVRFDAEAICDQWPGERSRVDVADRRYERAMKLVDVHPEPMPVVPFMVKRLHIRTDKGPDFLSERQQREAEQHLGAGWESGRKGVPVVSFEPTSMQRRYQAMKRLGRQRGYQFTILLKYRRGGFTTVEQADSYRVATEMPRSQVTTLAHTAETTRRIHRIVTTMYDNDPDKRGRTDKDSASKLELDNGSLFFIGTAGGKSANRGDTLQRFHGSEVSSWCEGPNQEERVDEIIAGLKGAASRGEGVLESTPKPGWFKTAWKEAVAGQNDLFPIFLRWFDDPMNCDAPGTFDPDEIRDTFTDEEMRLLNRLALTESGRIHHTDNGLALSWGQLAFRRRMKKRFKRLFHQEWPEDDESCFLSYGTPYFDNEAVIARRNRLPDGYGKKKRQVPGGYAVEIEPPQLSVEYCIGADTSEGIPGCDPNGLGVVRRDTGKQVAWIHGYFRTTDLAAHLVHYMRLYNNALTGVERENHGHAVLQEMTRLGAGKPHHRGGSLYYFKKPDKKEGWLERSGWSTNSASRPRMLSDLYDVLEDAAPHHILDREFLSECCDFKLQKTGKFEADKGCHDDRVMYWAIAYQMRHHKIRKPRIAVTEGEL